MPVNLLAPALTTGASLKMPAVNAKDSPQKIHDTAVQFEGILIGEILKAAKSADQSLSGEEQDNSAQTASDFATDYLARTLAAKGGLGIAQMIAKSLSPKATVSSSNPVTRIPDRKNQHLDKLPPDKPEQIR